MYSPRGGNNRISLPFGTSLFDLKEKEQPPASDLTVRDGLRLYSPSAALVRVSERFVGRNPVETRVVLASVTDVSEILRRLLEGGRSVVAGRLAGACRRTGRDDDADEILTVMKAAGYDVREKDPFAPAQPAGALALTGGVPPIASRIEAMWETMRADVLKWFPDPPGLPNDPDTYLRIIDGIYQSDAYHSLSIEGYRVSPELIARVALRDLEPGRQQFGPGGPGRTGRAWVLASVSARQARHCSASSTERSLRSLCEGATASGTGNSSSHVWRRA